MNFKNVPIPAAAEAAGMTNLVFSEDFETEKSIDFSGEGKRVIASMLIARTVAAR